MLKAAKRISSNRLRVAWLVSVSWALVFQGSEGMGEHNAKTPNICLSLLGSVSAPSKRVSRLVVSEN